MISHSCWWRSLEQMAELTSSPLGDGKVDLHRVVCSFRSKTPSRSLEDAMSRPSPSVGQDAGVARADSRMFEGFLKTLKHKTWTEVLVRIDGEVRRVLKSQRRPSRYAVHLIRLSSYVHFFTNERPESYESLLRTIPDLPDLLVEKTRQPGTRAAVSGVSRFEQS
jgi:hypothetical protein